MEIFMPFIPMGLRNGILKQEVELYRLLLLEQITLSILVLTISIFYSVYPKGVLKWSIDLGRDIKSSPAIGRDGNIYVGSDDNKLFSISQSGNIIWEYETDGDIDTPPVVCPNDDILALSDKRILYVINHNGTLTWTYQMEDWYTHLSVDSFGRIYFFSSGDAGRMIYSLDSDGKEIWRFSVSGIRANFPPTIGYDGTIYVGVSSDIYAINPDGSEKWVIDINRGSYTSSVVIKSNGVLYVS